MFKVRGFVAWWIWRTFYLFQMPRWNRRVRIGFDWTISLFFKNDVVELDVQDYARPPAEAPKATPGVAPKAVRALTTAVQLQTASP